ncbi:amidohydrolase [Litoribacter alkaliphilus]|uniref:Amidohydrolase n=1 Tax=Litoribacter ruber TaxID=702568 RepID=A0AAP2CGC9_9BACT|nr:amidohydrolase [Litoribacter alkaliphilus]MBS9523577.1 amidohydrolase [Litoribacter alkaliphilus]
MTQKELESLTDFRQKLHQHPELSNEEKETAIMVKDFFEPLKPDKVYDKLGGHGVAFKFEGQEDGPTTMIRCELDGLPIADLSEAKHASTNQGISHSCGHDGHMAIVAGMGKHLSANRPLKGNVVLLFQPAEETGEGAERVIKDKKYKEIQPDYAFALHNLPGYPEKQVVIKKGPFAAASTGMIIQLTGKTSHAGHPEDGLSPAVAMSTLMVGLPLLPESMKDFALITVVHAQLGKRAFGTSPGKATVMATLRSFDNDTLAALTGYAEALAKKVAEENKLQIEISYTESFAATENSPEAHKLVKDAAKRLGLKTKNIRIPFRWSEDFGHFSQATQTALFGLGAGKKQPQLHEPTYDFPDEIIGTGVDIFVETLKELHY